MGDRSAYAARSTCDDNDGLIGKWKTHARDVSLQSAHGGPVHPPDACRSGDGRHAPRLSSRYRGATERYRATTRTPTARPPLRRLFGNFRTTASQECSLAQGGWFAQRGLARSLGLPFARQAKHAVHDLHSTNRMARSSGLETRHLRCQSRPQSLGRVAPARWAGDSGPGNLKRQVL